MADKVQRISLYKTEGGTVFQDKRDAQDHSHFERFFFDLNELFETERGAEPLVLCEEEFFSGYIKDGSFHRFMKKFNELYKRYYPRPKIPSESEETE